jgi:hypothetical protein
MTVRSAGHCSPTFRLTSAQRGDGTAALDRDAAALARVANDDVAAFLDRWRSPLGPVRSAPPVLPQYNVRYLGPGAAVQVRFTLLAGATNRLPRSSTSSSRGHRLTTRMAVSTVVPRHVDHAERGQV